MVSCSVASLFTYIPTSEAMESVKQWLQQDHMLPDRTNLNPEKICALLDLCLYTTYFQYWGNDYRQKHGCAMASPISPIVANLYMEDADKKA